jgi:hypothetical protein
MMAHTALADPMGRPPMVMAFKLRGLPLARPSLARMAGCKVTIVNSVAASAKQATATVRFTLRVDNWD